MTDNANGRILSAILLSGVALSALNAGAFAQTAEDETTANGKPEREVVLVTARRVEEDIQTVPVAITAIDEEELSGRGILTLTDLQFTAPSVQMTTTYGRLNGGFAVRGLSGGTQTYFAEVPGGPTEASSAFYDIGSVQVLNGPQGTLFGRGEHRRRRIGVSQPSRPEFHRRIRAGRSRQSWSQSVHHRVQRADYSRRTGCSLRSQPGSSRRLCEVDEQQRPLQRKQ
ncbi:MAG: TonB-dependent receptor plug domain-containing protein [Hyphomonadaceae bacterium]